MSRARKLAGDWQTPAALAAEVCRLLRHRGLSPATVVEPTCGEGAFLQAASRTWPDATLVGLERSPTYAAEAQARVPAATIQVADAFTTDWSSLATSQAGPVLFLGNPPWVAASSAGAAGSPTLAGRVASTGLAAITGAADFDVAEWLLLAWIEALRGKSGHIAMLVKAHVARRLLETASPGALELWNIDARSWFGVSVPACLVMIHPDGDAGACPVHASLKDDAHEHWGLLDGRLVRDLPEAERTAPLMTGGARWRSGIKHDAGGVFELRHHGSQWLNRAGEPVDVEPEVLWPLRKSGDLQRDERPPRALLVPQRSLAEAPSEYLSSHPKALAYLQRHAQTLSERRSRIYRGRAPYSVFGLGDYSFAPYKIAISGLHPQLHFRLLEPEDGRAVMVDDTCYLLPFHDEASARRAHAWLLQPEVRSALLARLFPEAKRPVTARLLSQLRGPQDSPEGTLRPEP